MHAIALGEPDESLIETVLVKLFFDRQLDVGLEVVRFIMPRIERSFAATRHLVAAVDRAALTAKRRQITVPMVGAVLRDLDAGAPQDRKRQE
jgi:chromosomal replication initiation ATPase DnaA